MQRVVIDPKSFEMAASILSTLQEHTVAVVEAEYFDLSQKRAGSDFLVLSQKRTVELGGKVVSLKQRSNSVQEPFLLLMNRPVTTPL